MKAIIQTAYGSPDVFELRQIDRPILKKDNDVLVRVQAASIHAGDVFTMRGSPFLVRLFAGWPGPKNYIPGFDLAGIVEAVGNAVTRFKPGDAVFGSGQGTCAEVVCVKEKNLIAKPGDLSFDQAAAVPTSALTALIGLRDAGKVKPGQKVLINGASGGVGTFAIQFAKALGAKATGVCSTKNLELVRSIGADHVIDYSRDNFTRGEPRYDLILDQVANHSLADCRRVLTPNGRYIPNSGNSGLGYVLKAFAASLFIRRQGVPFVANMNQNGLADLKELIEAGKIIPVIDRTYPLSETAEAFRYLDKGHASGKVVITIS